MTAETTNASARSLGERNSSIPSERWITGSVGSREESPSRATSQAKTRGARERCSGATPAAGAVIAAAGSVSGAGAASGVAGVSVAGTSPPPPSPSPASGRSVGKRMTSRIVAAPEISMTSRSIPIPSPPVGGRPYSSAST